MTGACAESDPLSHAPLLSGISLMRPFASTVSSSPTSQDGSPEISTSMVSVYDSPGARSTRSKKVAKVSPVAASSEELVGGTLEPSIVTRPAGLAMPEPISASNERL